MQLFANDKNVRMFESLSFLESVFFSLVEQICFRGSEIDDFRAPISILFLQRKYQTKFVTSFPKQRRVPNGARCKRRIFCSGNVKTRGPKLHIPYDHQQPGPFIGAWNQPVPNYFGIQMVQTFLITY